VLGLPQELTFDQLASQLSALGVDVDGLMVLASQVLSPEDQQALVEATAQPIPLDYYWDWNAKASVDPKTGSMVDLYMNNDLLSMQPDYSSLMGLFSILMKYQQDPVMGPALEQLASLQAELMEAEPQRILKNNYVQTSDSVSDAIQSSKDTRGLLNLVRLWIPLIVIIVGALLLLGGIIWKVMADRS